MEDKLHKLIAADVPNIPEDVRDEWLLPTAKRNGWPPNGIYWPGVLLSRYIGFWKSTVWSAQEVDLQAAKFTPATRDAINQMYVGFTESSNCFGTHEEKERVLSPVGFILEHGSIPKQISLLKVGDGYEIIDGHHRYLGLMQALLIRKGFEDLKTNGGAVDTYMEILKRKWGITEIADIPTVHTVWVAEVRE